MNKWCQIWNKRTQPEAEDALERLIRADGFDSGVGEIITDSWRDYVGFIAKNINIGKAATIFEVGCGSGAFLFHFYQSGHKIGGGDYSESLIRMASDVMKDMDFCVCEANNIDTFRKYDFVISNSVFQYFPDLGYAESVIRKMLEKSNKAVAICDVPDLKLKEESELIRRGHDDGEYEKKYEGLNHLYYDRDWFRTIATKNDCRISLFDQNIRNYRQNKYRFNCVMEKL